MNNTKKYIAICLCLLVFLGGGLYFVLLIPESTENDPVYDSGTYEETVTTDVLFMDISLIESVGVQNENGEFEIIVTEDEETAEDGSLMYSYTVKGYENFAFNEAMLESAVQRSSQLTANRQLGQLEDLDLYGLEEPRSTVNINLKDGVVHTIYLGNDAGDTDGMYVMYDNNVYICDMNTALLNPVEASGDVYHLVVDELESEDGTSYKQLDKMTLSGTFYEEEISIIYDEDKNTHLIDSHGFVQANAVEIEEIVTALSNISSVGVEKYNPSEEELAGYGLAEPYQRIDFTLNNETHSITLSPENEDGQYYMYADDDKSVVYIMSETVVGPWAGETYLTLRSPYVFLPSISDVAGLYIDINGEIADIKIDSEEIESEDDSQSAYQYTVTVNGDSILYDNLTAFYLELISVAVLNDEEMTYSGERVVSVEFMYVDGSGDTLEYFVSDENPDRSVAVLNGEYLITVRTEDLDKLEAEYDLIVG